MVTIAVMVEAEATTTIRPAETMEEIMMTIIKRNTPDMTRPMRYLLLILAVIPLLGANGCSMFSSSRNTANDRDHPGNGAEAGHSSVLGQGENRGN